MSLSTLNTSTSSSTRVAPPKRERSRHAQIEQRLRRQPARAARLEQNALIALRQRDLRGGGPRLAAEVLEVGREQESGPRHVDAAHHAQHVRSIVRQPAARVGEVVRILAEGEVRRAGDGADLRACGGRPARDLQSGRSRVTCRTQTPASRCDRRFSTAITRPLYVIEYPSGFVSRKRRSAVELVSTNTGTLLPSGSGPRFLAILAADIRPCR